MSINLTFREDALRKALERFGKTVDDDGYVVDEEGRRVESNLGRELKFKNLGGIGNGSEVYIEDNFNSAAEFVEYIRAEDD